MQKPPQAESLELPGPVGGIEALFEAPVRREDAVGVAVVCHPHPLHGGTMHNKVAHMLAKAFLRSGFAAVRFNFRGVGKSDGEFADGDGEVEDVLAVIDWARKAFRDRPVWLAGFSFGAAMAVRAALQAELAGLVSVAPAAFRFAGQLDDQPRCPWLIVHGEDDQLIPISESVDWVNSLDPGPELVVFPETSHFFHGKLVDLRDTVVDFVERRSGQQEARPQA